MAHCGVGGGGEGGGGREYTHWTPCLKRILGTRMVTNDIMKNYKLNRCIERISRHTVRLQIVLINNMSINCTQCTWRANFTEAVHARHTHFQFCAESPGRKKLRPNSKNTLKYHVSGRKWILPGNLRFLVLLGLSGKLTSEEQQQTMDWDPGIKTTPKCEWSHGFIHRLKRALGLINIINNITCRAAQSNLVYAGMQHNPIEQAD